ncbi:MAG TPA: hypothetical protein DCX45_03575 [Acinetobacter junii]|nr:hypothetical protein [Acinetobacter junii]
MSETQKNTFWWWLKTTGQVLGTTAIAFTPELLQLLPEHTLLFKLALPIGFAVKLFMVKSDYQNNSEKLPGGVRSVMDKIPNKYTGIRDSKNADYIK